ncbi:peptidoglycan/LPS O-acetylase OafA/YrhL/class 3 adenylate cyclase [Mycobacterium sp. URHB0021]
MNARPAARLRGLDGIRGLAALFVVLHHCWLLSFPGYPRNTGPWWLGWLMYGHFAVVIFIVISGFSLSVAAARSEWQLRSVREFARRRSWRILPPYWAALALSLAVAWWVVAQPNNDAPTAKSVVVFGFLVQDVFDSPSPNGAFWSIAVEAQLYLLFPLLLLVRRRWGAVVVLAAMTAIVVAIAVAAPHESHVQMLMRLTPQFAPLFTAGIVAAGILVASDRARRLAWHWAALVAVVPVLVLIAARGSVWTVGNFVWVDLLLGPATALLLVAVAVGRPRPFGRLLETGAVQRLGGCSYSLYLTHALIVLTVHHHVVRRLGVGAGMPTFLVTLAIAVPLAVAFALWFASLFEIPFQRHRSWAAWREMISARWRERTPWGGTEPGGAWLLGKASESQSRRRVRIQIIMGLFIVMANLLGIGVALLLVTVAFPVPSVFADAPAWITFAVAPSFTALGLALGTVWITRRTVNALRWSIEGRTPTCEDQRNTFLAPRRVATIHLVLWGIGSALLTTLYGLQDTAFIPRFLLSVDVPGVVVATACYLLTEFALRPVAAQALEAGPPPRRLTAGIIGRAMIVWLLSTGVPVIGILLTGVFALSLQDLTGAQFAYPVMILAVIALVIGFLLIWLLSWLTATPVRGVRTALKHVEQGDLDCNLVVFDGTELGELQRGFNAMVDGLRERERVRDLFGRHVGREVAAVVEQEQPNLGGKELHAAVVFADIIGSTQLVSGRTDVEVVDVLNRFFAVIVEEVDRHRGLVNNFEGDAALAVFGAPVALEHPENEALAAARAIARRLTDEVPECPAGIGVGAGQVVSRNVGAKERFEYTVIGEPVNEAARLSELAKSTRGLLVASSDAVSNATASERTYWSLGDTVTLRSHNKPTRLALPV